MSRFEPLGFVVTLVDAAPQMPAPVLRRAETPPFEHADEEAPTVRLPSLDFAHAPTLVVGGWSPGPH